MSSQALSQAGPAPPSADGRAAAASAILAGLVPDDRFTDRHWTSNARALGGPLLVVYQARSGSSGATPDLAGPDLAGFAAWLARKHGVDGGRKAASDVFVAAAAIDAAALGCPGRVVRELETMSAHHARVLDELLIIIQRGAERAAGETAN